MNTPPLEPCEAGRLIEAGNCHPDPNRLRWLAARLVRKEEGQGLLAHTAQCRTCLKLLEEAIADFTAPLTDEELDFISRSKLSDPVKRHRFAEFLAKRAKAGRP